MSEHTDVNVDHVPPKDEEGGGTASEPTRLSLRQRLAHFTWANFTATQSSGGIATLLSLTPHQFKGLNVIGVIVFIFTLVLLCAFMGAMVTRAVSYPRRFKKSFVQAPEAFFYGSFWLSWATMIICMQRYGVPNAGPWLVVTVRVLFWIYAACTTINATVHQLVLFTKARLRVHQMNPAWFLLIFNTMLTGTVASAIASSQPPVQRLPILVAGIAFQGYGFLMSMVLLTIFFSNLMEHGLPPADQLPGLFMPVGSGGYTIVALIGCSRALPEGYAYFAANPMAIEVLRIVALWASIFIWYLTFWMFAIALLGTLTHAFPFRKGHYEPQMRFKLSWWGMIFPTNGLVLGTTYIGQELESEAILWIASVMTVLLVAAWLMDLILMAKAALTHQIYWPGHDEDKDMDVRDA